MEVDNLMIMPEYNYKFDYMEDDVWSELEDRAWEDIKAGDYDR